MNKSARILFFFLLPSLLLAASDEQQKVHKILNKVTAMTIDPAGKRAVSVAMSQHLSIARAELAQRRQAMNLKYGDLFVAYELVKSGTKMDDIAAKMMTGKTVWQAADEEHADWKQIGSEAKKLSGKVDSNLIGHFVNQKAEAERDRADGYNPFLDTVTADNDVSRQEIEDAQDRYVFLRDHTGVASNSSLDTSTERSARLIRTDPVRTGGPASTTTPPPTPSK
ncbi:MAG TPA: hypothetical protein VN310_16610 [Candidatus Dormibacteraeota bacterium]|jgi:hypothetical protein|nr:hypothetical protein [Candidatus Dormibacteraeota bacterium]